MEYIVNDLYPDAADGTASEAIFINIGGLVYYETENCFFTLDTHAQKVCKLDNKGIDLDV